jgi:DNA-binding IclR family transcriptional regulator
MYLSSLRASYLERFLDNAVMERRVPATITDKNALKAELEKTRARGYAIDAEEFMEGMGAIAVPIYDMQQRLVSTLSVHAPLQRVGIEALEAKVSTLQHAAEELSQLINS